MKEVKNDIRKEKKESMGKKRKENERNIKENEMKKI